jgi:transposase
MDVVYERCCGLDIHKRNVVACVLTPIGKEVWTFGTMAAEIAELVGWMQQAGYRKTCVLG